MKRFLLLLSVVSLSSCLTTKQILLNEENKFIIDLNDSVQMELAKFNYGATSYKGYSSYGEEKSPIVDLEWKVNRGDKDLNIADNLVNIRVHFYHREQRRVFDQSVSLIDNNGKIFNYSSQVKKGIFVSENSKIHLIYTYTDESQPYQITYNDKVYNLPISEELANEIASANIDNEKIKLFHDSVMNNNIQEVKRFIEIEKVDINSSIDGMPSALLIASANGNREIAEYLLNNGADPYKEFTSISIQPTLNPLSAAVYFDKENILDMFLEKNLDINKTAGAGWTPLLVAAATDNVKLFEKLINSGADTEASLYFSGSKTHRSLKQLAVTSKSLNVIKYIEDNKL